MKIRQLAAVFSCFFLTIAGTVQASTLTGSTVTATLYNPTLSTILGGPTTEIVGASTPTFPNGSIVGNTAFEINVTSDQIYYDPLANVTYGSGMFNGFVFTFAGAPTILGVTLDAASTFTPDALSFTANSVSFNLSGNTVTTNSAAILDIQLQPTSAAPEPATPALLIISISMFMFWAGLTRRKNRTKAL